MTDATFDGNVAPRARPPVDGAAAQRLITFIGRRASLLAILLTNAVLGLVTLGVYRFWARTRLRRYFWNSIEVDGDPLEYTGRGLELFIGFLIVLAVLVPVVTAYSVVAGILRATAPDFADALNFLYFVGLLWLARYAYFRARRYRLARTVWRGIRAGQDGSAATYALLWLGYVVFSILTLGWGVPWMTAALQEYEVENARFGNENFRYAGAGRELFRLWLPCAALWTLAIVLALAASIGSAAELERISQTLETFGQGDDPSLLLDALGRLLLIYGVAIVAFVASIPFYIVYRLGALRYMFNVASLAGVQFSSHFGAWRVFGYWLAQFATTVAVVFGFFLVLAIVGLLLEQSLGVDLSRDSAGGSPVGIALGFVTIVFFFVVLPVIPFFVFYYPVIRHVSTTLAMTDIASLDEVVQSSKRDPRYGEGLAAALDIDVGGF